MVSAGEHHEINTKVLNSEKICQGCTKLEPTSSGSCVTRNMMAVYVLRKNAVETRTLQKPPFSTVVLVSTTRKSFLTKCNVSPSDLCRNNFPFLRELVQYFIILGSNLIFGSFGGWQGECGHHGNVYWPKLNDH